MIPARSPWQGNGPFLFQSVSWRRWLYTHPKASMEIAWNADSGAGPNWRRVNGARGALGFLAALPSRVLWFVSAVGGRVGDFMTPP